MKMTTSNKLHYDNTHIKEPALTGTYRRNYVKQISSANKKSLITETILTEQLTRFVFLYC